MKNDFETEWIKVRKIVFAYCCRRLGDNRSSAEDIFQEVAIRAWLGYSSFRGDSKFLTWALKIAERQVNTAFRKPFLKTCIENGIEKLPYTTPDITENISIGWVDDVVKAALAKGELTKNEANVIMTRLVYPDRNWEQIGSRIGLTATNSAAIHCRAIPKLRVFIILNRTDLLGGQEGIKCAFSEAVADKHVFMTEEEAEVFRNVVLGESGYRKPGWQILLRSACTSVMKKIPTPWDFTE